jgi:alpha-glucan,water dikinase
MNNGWRSDGIVSDPLHMPHMINDFKHYLWILKTVHAGSDMKDMLVMAQVRGFSSI